VFRHRHAVHRLAFAAGRGALVGRRVGFLRCRLGGGRSLLAPFQGRAEVAGAGEHCPVQRADVDAVVEKHPIARPGEALDQIDAPPGAGRDAGQVVEVLHLLVALEPIQGSLRHTPMILPNRPRIARISPAVGIVRLTN